MDQVEDIEQNEPVEMPRRSAYNLFQKRVVVSILHFFLFISNLTQFEPSKLLKILLFSIVQHNNRPLYSIVIFKKPEPWLLINWLLI